MGSLHEGLFWRFFFWITLAQIKATQAQECNIISSISSPSASSLLVQWSSSLGATNYMLDLRVVNVSTVAPVVVTVSSSTTQREVFGLKPGTLYTVVLKVFRFYRVDCADTRQARTVPDTTQIVYWRAVSSTSISLEWERVAAVDRYFVVVNSTSTGERYNLSFPTTAALIRSLRPITMYDCFVVTSNAAGLGARSRVRTITTLVPPPLVVTVESTVGQAVRIRWQPVERVLLYRVTVKDNQGAQLVSATVSTTFLDVQNMLPCSTYQIGVSSMNTFLEPGEWNQIHYTTNTLSPVTSVTVEYSCVNATAIVYWSAVFGAESYHATAVDQAGRTKSCNSTSTMCHLDSVGCGNDYMLQVSAIANNCESTANAIANFHTVPCAPANLQLFRECSSNVIIFSWASTDNTAFYMARAVDSTGLFQDCVTTDTSCFFINTVCGRNYNFTVYAVNGECNSPVSPAVSINTAPCKPKNMVTITDCQSDLLTSMWDRAAGALSYVVEGHGNCGNLTEDSYYICNSVSTSCVISGVACGESLTMKVTSFDDQCSSESTLGLEANSVPCMPQNVSAIIDCSSDSVTVSWNMSHGALFYIAMAVDSSGGLYTCNTLDLRCQITGLQCGTVYNASIISSNYKCNSSASSSITVETAPCPPSHVQTQLDCGGNRAWVSWYDSRSPASYTATMENQNGGLLSCRTEENSCWVPNLMCSQVYNVSVTYHNGICSSKPSSPIRMKSVPCGPANFQALVDCSSGLLLMSWNPTDGADGYRASVVSVSSGGQLFCNSSSPNCSLSSLVCGESYVAQVQSYNSTCFSMLSLPVTVKEVPCVPTNMRVESTCGSSTTVSWQASSGAQSYRVIAEGNRGHQTECSSSNTTCSLMDLLCGQVYTISVMAMDDACSSLRSESVTLKTAPCTPFNVHGVIECSSNAVTLSWDSSPNAVSYIGTAVGSNNHSVWCNSSSTGCRITDLHCGQDYTVRVMASDGVCVSSESEAYTQPTAPCAPWAVSNTLRCDSNSVSVSWGPSTRPLNYSAIAIPGSGAVLGCTTSNTGCDIAGLQCGQNYTLSITSTNRVCTGPESTSQIIQTAPCMPVSVRASVTCLSNTVSVSWAPAVGALSYVGILTSLGGSAHSCSTSGLYCIFNNLPCAQTYTLNIVSNNDRCNSTASPDLTVSTAPCDPGSVVAELQCDSGTVNVSWSASAGASSYTILAYAPNQAVPSSSCISTSTSCAISQLACGTTFDVYVLAGDGACNSSSHATTTIKTAPCPPILQISMIGCYSEQAVVSWTGGQDALGVSVNAESVLNHSVGCNSASQSCTLQGLWCGQTYTVQATTQGLPCNSIPSDPLSIVTVPCAPAAVHINYTCATSKAVLSWNESLGRESFIAQVQTQDHWDSCSSTQTQCSLSSLLCGRVYDVSVVSTAGACNSSSVASTQMKTAPCAPQNVSANLQCSDNTALVYWTESPGAVSYNVTALGSDGDTKYCHSTTTSCQVPSMHCAQLYSIIVTPFSEMCNGFQSSSFTFSTGPCPPSGIQVSLLCDNNIGSVSWTAIDNAEVYSATATSTDGQVLNCTTTGTNCSFLALQCGENYSVTVRTLEKGCWSKPSTPVLLRSAICPPANLAGLTQCSTNDITITWDPSPQSEVTYFLYSQQDGGPNSTYSTIATSYTLNGLQCGWIFTVQVAVQDNTCTSRYSVPVQIRTAPCPPSNLAATSECGSNLGVLSWGGGVGVLFYTTSLVSNEADTISCTSTNTTCVVKLECSSSYTATVAASTGSCNSTANSSIDFISAPCLAGDIQSQLNCTTNSLAVQWAATSGKPKYYTALALGTDGTRPFCNTSTTSCTIQDLRCGLTYGIAVIASNIQCDIQGSEYQVQTAPCKAENSSVSLVCETNIATVQWTTAGTNQLYKVSAVNYTGVTAECASTGMNCTFNQFGCGETYTLTIEGVTEQCTSQPSIHVDFGTVPCNPTQVQAVYDCSTSITSVMWDNSIGAEDYVVYAVGSNGHQTNCTSTDTNCDIADLLCGQDYKVTVMAERGGCISLPSQSINVSTGPCPHSNPHVVLDCSSSSALISWTPGKGIIYYNASADAISVVNTVTCSTDSSSCNVTNLQCAQQYEINVSGQGHTCLSPAQEWVLITTGPCPPNQVTVLSSCRPDTVTMSWDMSPGSLYYLAVAEDSGGQQFSCRSNGTTCDINGLQCGQTYEVYVSGVNETCGGMKSQVHIVKTAPCVPQNVQVTLECQSTVLNATWEQMGVATRYLGVVETSSGEVTLSESNEPHFTVSNILCGLTYSLSVTAQNEICNSSRSSVQHTVSAPCPPQAISTVLDCTSNTIFVNWSSSSSGISYMAQAVSSNGYYTCNSTNTHCSIQVLCGVTYNISVLPIQNGCTGVSSPYKIITAAPCVPTLMDVEMDCLFHSAFVVWEKSAGAESYTAVAVDSDGHQYKCNSSNSLCEVSGLQCGQHYNFSLTANNEQCHSAVSNAMQSETAPCAPEDVKLLVGCESGTVSVSWLSSIGALTYTATLEGINVQSSCCTPPPGATFCNVTSLPCGQMYVVTVVAAGRTCNSSQSSAYTVQTAPCQPQGLNSSLSCSNNVASVWWTSSLGAQLYTVNAESNGGAFTDTCNGFDGSCDLRGLKCGQQYTATVVARHSNCYSLPSLPIRIRTVPCVPQNVSLEVECQARNLSVIWDTSLGPEFYTVTLLDSRGLSTNCQSLSDRCTINGLTCGNIYHASVVASDDYCSSQPSNTRTTDSVPCAPGSIHTLMDIQTGSAMLSWQMSAGAVLYRATAVSSLGQSVSCEIQWTSCELLNLVCGDKYNVSVLAVGLACNNLANMSGYLETGPCVAEHVSVSYTLPVALIQWDTSRGAVNYTAVAMTQQGLQTSCSSTDTSCVLYNLSCSQTYNVTVTAYNSIYQESNSSAPITFETEPCPPSSVTGRVVNDQGEVAWEPSPGAVGYIVVLEGGRGDTLSCQTNETSCSVLGLECGTVYVINVFAFSLTFNSSSSEAALLTSVPCLPDTNSFAVAVHCENDSASVSWEWSDGATSYQLTATGNSGDQKTCTTNQNSCQITNLECGQTYNLSLAAMNSAGTVTLDTSVTFQSQPCVPLHVEVNMECGTQMAMLTWEQSPGVIYYQASATFSLGGAATWCNSSAGSCRFGGLQCGGEYLFSVRAYTAQCNSNLSSTVYITTEPCQPQNLTVTGSCESNTLVFNWAAAAGALLYTVSATGNLGYTNSIQTNSSQLQLDVPCGQSYSFTVMSLNEGCNSLPSTPVRFTTAPCVPMSIQTYILCEDSVGSVNWASSDGAVSYTAVAQGKTLGSAHTCSTNETSCTWTDLLCGEEYTVQVTANNMQCSSAFSGNTTIHTAPCIPQIVGSRMDCDARIASLTWQPSRAARSYLVKAENVNGHKLELTTNSTSAQILELHCGQLYYLTVISLGQWCRSGPSNASGLQTDPCPPTAVSASMDCVSNIALMTWMLSDSAEYYTVKASGSDGGYETCMSSTTSCGIATLQCGKLYNVTVTASRHMCFSVSSQLTYLNTAPCVPVNVSVVVDCAKNEAWVSWSHSWGAMFYRALAKSKNNDYSNCNSSGPDMQCILGGLTCGADYTVQVVAVGNECSSLPSQPVEFHSVPCVPAAVQASLLCSSNSVNVTWQRSSGDVHYEVEGVSTNGLHTILCNSSLLSCNLQELHCGTSYNVSVVAVDDTCSSGKSVSTQVQSATCAPQNVNVQVSCSGGSMTVTWPANPHAESFHVEALTSNGGNLSCDSIGTSCSISGLPCGLSYSVTVRAVREGCQDEPSTAVHVSSAPCVPQGGNGTLDCVTNAVWVSWQSTAGAHSYQVLAVTRDNSYSSCRTSSLYCSVSALQCGARYTFVITAVNSWCSSAPSNTFQIETSPCTLTGISAVTECYSSFITVSWLTQSSSSFHVATAEGQDLSYLECNSTGTSCTLRGVQCGMLYTIMVSASSDRCSSLRSPPYTISTAPCAPLAVSVQTLCDVEGVLVSWTFSDLAQSYSLTATGQDGDAKTCTSATENCTLTHLHCSQPYTISISASAGNCTSPASQPVIFHTAPCVPEGLDVSFSCENASAVLSWSASEGSESYYTSARTLQGDEVYCDTLETSCSMRGLHCGEVYNFSVKASDGTCNSSQSQPLQKGAEPCPPASVKVRTHNMEDSTLVRVYWSAVTCPNVLYLAELSGSFNPLALIQVASYWTERRYFEFPVPCDFQYSVTVRAGSQTVSGAPSAAVNGSAAPCTVTNVNNTDLSSGRRRRDLDEAEILDGVTAEDALSVPKVKVVWMEGVTLHVEWEPVTEASSYTLIVQEDTPSSPQSLVLTVQGETWDISDLKPGIRYCITMSARSSDTKSAFSQPVCTTTALSM